MAAPFVEAGIFALAVAFGFFAQRVSKVFVIPALLLGGVALGPGGLGVLQDQAFVDNANHVGLVLLLFFTSLFAHPKALRMGGRVALPLAGYDLVLNFAAAYWIGSLFGMDIESRLFLAGVMATSSTGTILKILSDEGRLMRREGHVLVALLWIEDLAFIGYYMFLSGRHEFVERLTSWQTGVGLASFLVFLGILRLGREWVWSVERREILIPLITGLGLLGTYLGSLGGLPYVGSAFTAGLVLSGSRGAQFVQTEAPFLRDVAATMFFFSFGALLDPHATMNLWPLALLTLAGILVTEMLFLPTVARLLGLGSAESFVLGASLVARGGKSAAFAKLGSESPSVNLAAVAQIQNVSGILTVLLTPLAPLLVRFGLWIRRRGSGYGPGRASREVVSALTRRVLTPSEFAQRHLSPPWSRTVIAEWIVLVFLLGLLSCLVPFPWRTLPVALGMAALVPAYHAAHVYFGRSPGNPSMKYHQRRRALPQLQDFLPALLLGPCLLALAFSLMAPVAATLFPAAAALALVGLWLLPWMLHPLPRAPRLARVLPAT